LQHRPRVDGHELTAQVSDTPRRKYFRDGGELTLLILAVGDGVAVKARGDILCARLELQILRLGASSSFDLGIGAAFGITVARSYHQGWAVQQHVNDTFQAGRFVVHFRRGLYFSLLIKLTVD